MPKTNPKRGSYMPVLIKLLNMTEGPVWEFGSGMYSTPFLHWYCFYQKRKLVTFEDHPEWREFAEQFKRDWHDVVFVTDWDALELRTPVTIAFVDHDPITDRKRADDVDRLRHAEFVVCHDSENSCDHKYKYSKVLDLFKYRYKYKSAGLPYTSVFSNKTKLDDFTV